MTLAVEGLYIFEGIPQNMEINHGNWKHILDKPWLLSNIDNENHGYTADISSIHIFEISTHIRGIFKLKTRDFDRRNSSRIYSTHPEVEAPRWESGQGRQESGIASNYHLVVQHSYARCVKSPSFHIWVRQRSSINIWHTNIDICKIFHKRAAANVKWPKAAGDIHSVSPCGREDGLQVHVRDLGSYN